MINWKQVDHRHFEKFVYSILRRMEFKNIQWFGRGGSDQGRDVVAKTYETLPFNLGYERKWVFQCKKWATMPNNSTIVNEIITVNELHSPDFWVMVIPVDLTSSQLDFIESLNRNYPFKIIIIPLVHIEEMLFEFPETKNILINGDIEGAVE
ncbi:restriction endonuclease [Bacillus sp. SCS-151]|uniref:restriction endonuclease n=1 Tax=Nanhaiella sioensis TaxID=3115293 RepID=UPI00397E0995